MSENLERARLAYADVINNISDLPTWAYVVDYVRSLEQALARAQDRDEVRVVEVEPSVLGNATALHVAVYDNLRAGPVTLVLKKDVSK